MLCKVPLFDACEVTTNAQLADTSVLTQLAYDAGEWHVQAYIHMVLTLLIVPQTRTKFGDRAFSAAGLTVWNSLSESVRSAETLASFKRKLKTYQFNISFLSSLCLWTSNVERVLTTSGHYRCH